MALKPENLMQALLAKMNDQLTGGDGKVPSRSNTHFITWITPGMPFMPEDFEFCSQGITGTIKRTPQHTGAGASALNATDAKGESEATKTLKLIGQAHDFSLFADFIPEKDGVYRTSQERLSKICENVLRMSKVVKTPLTKKEEDTLKRFRDLMHKEVEQEDLITGEKKKLTVESPMMVAYNEAMQAYEDAALLYNAKRVNAASAVDRAAVLDFATNASIYYNKVKAAMNAWISKGYKNEVEKMNAYINAVGMRDLSLWKKGLIENMDRSKLTDPTSNAEFYYTSLFPRTFATSKGWTGFTFKESEFNSYSKSVTTKWDAGAGLNLGLWSVGGAANSSKSESEFSIDMSNFSMSFEMTQALVSRPWCPIEFFSCTGWTLDKGTWRFSGGKLPLSTGGNDPDGPFIAYPTAAIFARNIHINFNSAAISGAAMEKHVGAGGNVGYGPFYISGKYERGEQERSLNIKTKGEGLYVEGMCLIGFVNRLIGKVPNLDPSIKPSQLQ